MTVEQQVDALATAVDGVKASVATKKAALDASVADAQAQTALAQTAKTATLSARDQASAFKDAAYTAAQSAASAVAYQDLTALALSKAVTAVDVFIYDTSKDSDGGAWRHRCAGTSWYNDPLNTATRGARRGFPAVAVLVLTASNLTIYDADDPTLPMWMVLNAGLGAVVAYGNTVNSVFALNSEIVVGSAGVGGLSRISLFEKPYQLLQGGVYYTVPDRGLLANRNGGVAWPSSVADPTRGLVNGVVNDVAMTVLPDAPIDPATGLPVPTIAVATAGGVSVITASGAVYDSANTNPVNFIDFYGQRMVAQSVAYGWFRDFGDVSAIIADGFGGITYNDGGYPRFKATFNQSDIVGFDVAQSIGLTKFAPDFADKSKGMSAMLTSTYNTGWMPGDIKGALLSSKDTASLVGSGELVTNGTFDTDTSGWTAGNGATLASVSGQLQITSTVSGYGQAVQAITTVVGKTYVVIAERSNGFIAIGTTAGGTTLYTNGYSTSPVFAQFTATTTTTYITLQNDGTASGVRTWDNISVKLADADRSVNNKGLIVNGTITRAPVATGAELVAYSGFSGGNFLEQPFNSGLNFGAGDFCIMGWSRFTNLGTWQGLFARTNRQGASAGSTDTMYARLTDQGKLGFYLWTGTATTSQTISDAVPFWSWVFWALVRRGGVLQWFVNGVPSGAAVSDGTDVSNVTDGTEAFLIGKEYFGGGGFASGNTSFALFRIGATAPTADQIRRIYEDEKALFQPGAQCTLYGTSDAVTALAHDPDTGLLHVGTSAGRSVFKGLRRVANTTTPVATAIAACGDLVVEQ